MFLWLFSCRCLHTWPMSIKCGGRVKTWVKGVTLNLTHTHSYRFGVTHSSWPCKDWGESEVENTQITTGKIIYSTHYPPSAHHLGKNRLKVHRTFTNWDQIYVRWHETRQGSPGPDPDSAACSVPMNIHVGWIFPNEINMNFSHLGLDLERGRSF